MNDEHHEAAARALIARDPELARHYSFAEVMEQLRTLAESMRLEAARAEHFS